MYRKFHINNSTVLFLGLILILVGISVGLLELFNEKKEKAYADMNLRFFENEEPSNINSEEEVEKRIEETESDEQNNNSPSSDNPEEPSKPSTKYNYIGMLEIPKINLKRGFVDIDSKYNSINYNIAIIKGSTFPDEENNNLILASHSGNCSICFFNKLYKVSLNDVAYIYYKQIKYEYKVVDIYEVDKTGTVAIYRNPNKQTLTLITCTKNSNTKQTVYILELNNKESY